VREELRIIPLGGRRGGDEKGPREEKSFAFEDHAAYLSWKKEAQLVQKGGPSGGG